MVKTTKVKSGGGRKLGRNKRRVLARVNAISQYIRNVITAEEYFKRTGQKVR